MPTQIYALDGNFEDGSGLSIDINDLSPRHHIYSDNPLYSLWETSPHAEELAQRLVGNDSYFEINSNNSVSIYVPRARN